MTKPFTLEAVLDHRRRLKDIARNRFAAAQSQYNLVKKNLEDKIAERESLIERLSHLQMSGIDILENIRYENRIEQLKSEILRLSDQVKKKREIIVRERTHLLQKSKEYRVMENLKEKQNSEWRQFLDKKESAMLDEIAVLYRNR